MISRIRDDVEKQLYIERMKQIDELFVKQSYLLPDARMAKEVLLKLEKLYQDLEDEIYKYEKINATDS